MNLQERIAWIMAMTAGAILIYLGEAMVDLLTLEAGLITAKDGLGGAIIGTIVIATVAELAADTLTSQSRDETMTDERTQLIKYRSAYYGMSIMSFLIFGIVGSLLFTKIATIQSVDTMVIFAGAVMIVHGGLLVRHISEILFYRIS